MTIVGGGRGEERGWLRVDHIMDDPDWSDRYWFQLPLSGSSSLASWPQDHC